jgi:hypothetical protein
MQAGAVKIITSFNVLKYNLAVPKFGVMMAPIVSSSTTIGIPPASAVRLRRRTMCLSLKRLMPE